MHKIILAALILVSLVFSQSNNTNLPAFKMEKMATAIASDTQFNPQSSTIFTFLGLSPAAIQRPSLIRDLKFDGGISGAGKISMGFETQPIWLLACRRLSYSSYSRIPGFFRNLINTSISLGIKQDAFNSVGYAIKIPIFFKDPMADKEYIKKLDFSMSETEEGLIRQIQTLDYYLMKNMFATMPKAEVQAKRAELNKQLEKDDATIKANAMAYKEQYQASNWNAAQMNVYFAHGFDIDSSVDPMIIQRQYMSGWIVANQPIGKFGILNEIGKVYYEMGTVSTNLNFIYGINLTFGSPKANFFVEGLVSATTNDAVSNFAFNFGGWFKPSEKISFDLGIHLTFNKAAYLINLTPAFNISLRL